MVWIINFVKRIEINNRKINNLKKKKDSKYENIEVTTILVGCDKENN